ncbi:diguanylate cyclase (GGDEF) domain-containing protein [Phyllobacterium sp. YR620]|uniref:GGDEF domain-containing protein n=1 Tax=Phyllobacterium sp. YR620 TaxID=1881066 RepID=UPI000891DAC9|nr:GGDEF domain-containing protein [Phyllobacterium sp. YR620]SDP80671.1 diguanylate cyclase (GGDEF) domain-containing protein [Phyllobacterium sp. YR620]
MSKVIFKCILVTIVMTASCVVITNAIREAVHMSDGPTRVIAILCPLLITPPVIYLCLRQSEKLRQALTDLNRIMQELETTNVRLFEASLRDNMTGLLNRETFFERMEALRRQGPGSLLIVDADHFKKINDNHGHHTGDAALIAIAQCISRCIGEDDCAGRIGGEEFAIFLATADETEVRGVAECIRAEVCSHALKSAEGAEVPLSVSIGGVAGVAAGTVKEHFRTADRRLYDAKRRGRNCVSVRSPVKNIA